MFIISLPEANKTKRVKDIIVQILLAEWPLSIKETYTRCINKYSCNCTYQSVYKSLNELFDEGVISKTGNKYLLNIEWAERIKNFSEYILTNYNGKSLIPFHEGVIETKIESNSTTLKFKNLLDLDKMWIKIKDNYYKNLEKKGDITIWDGAHCWWLLVYPELEYSELDRAREKNVNHYMIVRNSFSLDKWSEKFYKQIGVNFMLSDEKSETDIGVFGDTIMQVKLPKKLADDIKKLYSNHSFPAEVDIPSFIKNVLKKDTEIELVLIKNKEIADQLKRKVLSEFEGVKNIN